MRHSRSSGFTTKRDERSMCVFTYTSEASAGRKTFRGFTLIELLVVISIIGLLSSIVLVSLATARTKAYDAQRLSNLKNVQTALEVYYTANSGYPSTSGKNYNSQCTGGFYTPVTASNVIPGLVPTYLPSSPIDPKTNGTNQCCYSYVGDGKDYKFMFFSCVSDSVACTGPIGTTKMPNPARADSCVVYTDGASTW